MDNENVIYVRRVKLDRGGYAQDGRYFGTGEKVWSVDNGDRVTYIRAPSWEDAKDEVRRLNPGVKVR